MKNAFDAYVTSGMGRRMATTLYHSDRQAIEELLLDLCAELQIDDSQYERANTSYRAIGAYLGEENGPFASLHPDIYPQGSMALQTAIKPVGDCEFDVDLVYEIDDGVLTPAHLYQLILTRLRTSGVYLAKVQPKNRCIRINYAGDFHLDILPAVRNPNAAEGSILIVDRDNPATIGHSNPKGYQDWFRTRAAQISLEEVRKMAALPANPPASDRSVLARAVQLIKRRRALRFGESDLAPRSIIITTFAAAMYSGSRSVFDTMRCVVGGINALVSQTAPNRIRLVNPTRPEELFTDRFTDLSYAAFVDFFAIFERELDQLAVQPMPNLGKSLVAMFGERETREALRKRDARDIGIPRTNGTLRVVAEQGRAGLASASIVAGTRLNGHLVRANTFFGK